jgi:hypothetical protein
LAEADIAIRSIGLGDMRIAVDLDHQPDAGGTEVDRLPVRLHAGGISALPAAMHAGTARACSPSA